MIVKKDTATNTAAAHVLGFDGGGTKSICVIAQADGTVKGVGRSDCTNFQGVGVEAAKQEVARAIELALKDAKLRPDQIATAAFGIAGADRDEDFETVAGYVDVSQPAPHWMLVNDTTIALRAGTSDGIGVAMVCGTGSNCIGFNAAGKQAKVGGLGHLTGDVGGGEDIVEKAIIASLKAEDGRAPKTILGQRLAQAMGLKKLEDVIVFTYADNFQPVNFGQYSTLVFKCAAEGDRVAQRLLERIGREQAHSVVTACKRLFKKDETFPVVLGGSIMQKSNPPYFADAIKQAVGKRYPNASVHKLTSDPVIGAVGFALDLLHGKAGRNRMAKLKRSYKPYQTS